MKYLIFLTVIFTSCRYNSESKSGDDAVARGEELFNTRCATCHLPDTVLLGPALKDVAARWPDSSQLRQFIRNSGEVIGRNIYANALFRQYRYSPMPAFPQLSDADIDNILLYCKEYRPIK